MRPNVMRAVCCVMLAALLLCGCARQHDAKAPAESDARSGAPQQRGASEADADSAHEIVITIDAVPETLVAFRHTNELSEPLRLSQGDILHIRADGSSIRLRFDEDVSVRWLGLMRHRVEPVLRLTTATPDEIAAALDLEPAQAEALAGFAKREGNRLLQLWETPINYIAKDGSIAQLRGPPANSALPLHPNHLNAIIHHATLHDLPAQTAPATVAVVPDAVLEEFAVFPHSGRRAIREARDANDGAVETINDLVLLDVAFTIPALARYTEFCHEQCLVVALRRAGREADEDDLAVLMVFDEPLKRRESVYLLD